MRQVSLNWFEDRGDFVDSLKAPGPVVLAPFTQGDTIRFAVTKMVKAESGLVPLTVKPWSFDQIRMSIGYIDQRPDKGTFKLTIDGTPTTTITVPADWTDAAAVATWKAGIITAINAVAGTGAARLDDPTDAPAHFLFITWTAADDDRALGISEVSLVPPIDTDAAVQVLQPVPAFSQVVKLSTLPLVIASDFEFPDPVDPEMALEEDGSASKNEVQLLILPEGLSGALDLLWDSVHTSPLPVDGLTADDIAEALNAIVDDGGSNPSFTVVERKAQSGRKFAIEFIGPLAKADQAALVVTPRDQDASLTAFGDMELRRESFERALYGQSEITLQLEFVVTAGGGESTVLREITLLNDMTSGATETSAEEQGAVFVRTETVIVDNSTLTPIATVAAGAAVTPPAALSVGAELLVNHALGSRKVRVRIMYEDSLSPEYWRELSTAGEFSYYSTSTNQVAITFAFALTNTPGDTYYRGRFEVQVISPDSTVQLLEHQHAWADLLETLPSGQTLVAKLAAIEAALGMVDGTLPIAASRIVGLLKSSQIDLASLATAQLTSAEFLATLRELVKDPTLVENLGLALKDAANFLATLKTLLVNSELLAIFVPALLADSTFNTALHNEVISALQGGAALPDGFTELTAPDLLLDLAPPYTLGTVEGVPITGYPELPIARTGLSAGDDVSGELSPVAVATVHEVVGYALSPDFGARRGQRFLEGALDPLGNTLQLVNPFGFWYAVTNFGSGTNWYPAEMERVLRDFAISEEIFYAGSQFLWAQPFYATLFGGWHARLDLILEIGYDTAEATTQLASVAWTALRTWTLRLSEVTAFRKLSVRIPRGADVVAGWARTTTTATITTDEPHGLATGDTVTVLVTDSAAAIVLGVKTIVVSAADTFTFVCLNAGAAGGTLTYGVFAAFVKTGVAEEAVATPTGPNFRLRLRTSKFDLDNPPATIAPTGTLRLSCAGTRASIAPL